MCDSDQVHLYRPKYNDLNNNEIVIEIKYVDKEISSLGCYYNRGYSNIDVYDHNRKYVNSLLENKIIENGGIYNITDDKFKENLIKHKQYLDVVLDFDIHKININNTVDIFIWIDNYLFSNIIINGRLYMIVNSYSHTKLSIYTNHYIYADITISHFFIYKFAGMWYKESVLEKTVPMIVTYNGKLKIAQFSKINILIDSINYKFVDCLCIGRPWENSANYIEYLCNITKFSGYKSNIDEFPIIKKLRDEIIMSLLMGKVEKKSAVCNFMLELLYDKNVIKIISSYLFG